MPPAPFQMLPAIPGSSNELLDYDAVKEALDAAPAGHVAAITDRKPKDINKMVAEFKKRGGFKVTTKQNPDNAETRDLYVSIARDVKAEPEADVPAEPAKV